jgi:REP element-mobilizing transposase RayT
MSQGHLALRRGRQSLTHHVYHVTTATKARAPFFRASNAAHAAARCFTESSLLGDCHLLAWVLMPDHVHWLIRLGIRDSLDVVVNRLKSSSARKANAVLGRNGALWEKAYHDRAMRSDDDLARVASYIVANPVRAGLVEDIGH